MGTVARVVPGWWGDLCDDFFRYIARKGARPGTLVTYRTELRDFGALLMEQRITSLAGVGRHQIEDWQDELRRRKSPSTQRVAATALKGLLKFAAAEELELSSPTLYLRVILPRVPDYQPRPVPDRDLKILQAALADAEPDHPWRLRTRALFWLLYSSGCRLSEALSLMRGAVQDDAAAVIQKGGRPHTIVLGRKAIGAIDDYMRVRTDDIPSLFVSLRHDGPLGRKEVQESWDVLAAALEIRRFKSHELRHSCVTEIIRGTGDVALAARHVGHASLQMIMRYAAVGMDKRREAVALLDRVAIGASAVAATACLPPAS